MLLKREQKSVLVPCLISQPPTCLLFVGEQGGHWVADMHVPEATLRNEEHRVIGTLARLGVQPAVDEVGDGLEPVAHLGRCLSRIDVHASPQHLDKHSEGSVNEVVVDRVRIHAVARVEIAKYGGASSVSASTG